MIQGWYYLHVNGELIYKRDLNGTAADIRESDFAVGMWPVDIEDRKGAWNTLVEAWAAGAKQYRLLELAEKWGCDDNDAMVYTDVIGANLFLDGNKWCATRLDFEDLQKSPAGFGHNALEALAELCKALGYKPSKMWGQTFESLLK